MNKKLFLTGVITVMLSCPAFADNEQANITDENKGCTSDTLTVSSGSASLEAVWDANDVNITWYDGNTALSNTGNAATCKYDGVLNLPTVTPKPGYTFAGWTVRSAAPATPQQTTITLSSLYNSGSINVFASKSLNPGEYCEGSSGWDDEIDDYALYGTDQQGEGACSNDSRFSGLNNGEWTVTMPNGNKVKGVATCSTEHPTTPWYDNNNTFTSDHYSNTLTAGQYSTDNSSGMQYCWCKVTSGDTGNGYQSVASSSWVFYAGLDYAANCALDCANRCAYFVPAYGDFRRAVFGVTQ